MTDTESWKTSFDHKLVARILSGEEPAESLDGCFNFAVTPEGHRYWWDISDGTKPFNDKARERLTAMINEHYSYRAYLRLQGKG